MTDKVLCRYYLEGTCRYGNACVFSHDLRDAPSMVCKYWAAGYCKFGSKCHFDHARPEKPAPAAPGPPASTAPLPSAAADPTLAAPAPASLLALQAQLPADLYDEPEDGGWAIMDDDVGGAGGDDTTLDPWTDAAAQAAVRAGVRVPVWASALATQTAVVGGGDGAAVARDAGAGLCVEHLATGACPLGAGCDRAHGTLCELCGRYALHPTDARAAAAHAAECAERHARLAARARAAPLECAICMERVLGKPDHAQRRFGLLNCDHTFCLGCIRAWRAEGEVNVDTALRTCPICRQTAHFVTPSTIWPESAEQRQAIIDGYRTRLASIDCMHFDHGRGTCPFGASCHYRHAYDDGTLQDRSTRLAATEEGDIQVLERVRLSDFISIKHRPARNRKR